MAKKAKAKKRATTTQTPPPDGVPTAVGQVFVIVAKMASRLVRSPHWKGTHEQALQVAGEMIGDAMGGFKL